MLPNAFQRGILTGVDFDSILCGFVYVALSKPMTLPNLFLQLHDGNFQLSPRLDCETYKPFEHFSECFQRGSTEMEHLHPMDRDWAKIREEKPREASGSLSLLPYCGCSVTSHFMLS